MRVRERPPFGRAAMLATLVAVACACADDSPKFAVNYAPGFVKDGNAISVFGVFRDGRMNPEAWDELGPRIAAALHKNVCDIAVSNMLRVQQPTVFAAVDSEARADGITDELLDKLAPAAAGDSILVLTVAGHPPKAKDGGATESAAPSLTTTGRGGRGGRRSGAPRTSGHHGGPDTNVFEMSASLFSKRQHQSVAMVAMTYTGPSEEDAIARFVEKLASAFPGATCAGWNAELFPEMR